MRKFASFSMLAIAAALLVGSAAVMAADPVAGTGSISGTVVDKDGKAVAKATVTCYLAPAPKAAAVSPLQAGGGPGTRPAAAATATTDDKGAFKLEKLAAGSYRVMAVSEDKTMRGRAAAAVDVKDGAETKLDKDITIQARAPRGGGGGGGGGGAPAGGGN